RTATTSRSSLPLATSHTRSRPPFSTTVNRLASAESPSACTPNSWPLNWRSSRPVFTSHQLTVRSFVALLAEARCLPSALERRGAGGGAPRGAAGCRAGGGAAEADALAPPAGGQALAVEGVGGADHPAGVPVGAVQLGPGRRVIQVDALSRQGGQHLAVGREA